MSKLFFKSTDELVEFVPIPISTSFSALKPKIEHVQSKWLKPLFGTTFITELLELISGADGLSDLQQEAIDKIRFPLANYLLHESTDLLNISVVEGGFLRNAGEDKVAASANSIVQFKEQLLIDAQSGFDILMSFLEEHADDFTTWKNSDERKAFKQSFVKSSDEFNSGLLGIQVGEFVFRKMYPVMQTLEPRLLVKVIGKELYDDMKDKLTNSTSLGVYAPILPYIQRAISAATFTQSCYSLGVKVDSRGVYISSIKNANEPQQNNPITPGKELNVETIHSQHATKCFEDLASHLYENADTYPLFKNSNAYTDRSTSTILPEEGAAAYYAM